MEQTRPEKVLFTFRPRDDSLVHTKMLNSALSCRRTLAPGRRAVSFCSQTCQDRRRYTDRCCRCRCLVIARQSHFPARNIHRSSAL